MNINYRELLKKYIRHVGEEEGISFIRPDWPAPKFLTEEEWKELALLDKESADDERLEIYARKLED